MLPPPTDPPQFGENLQRERGERDLVFLAVLRKLGGNSPNSVVEVKMRPARGGNLATPLGRGKKEFQS
jgi:hypothetical protein